MLTHSNLKIYTLPVLQKARFVCFIALVVIGCEPKERPAGIEEGLRSTPSSTVVMDVLLPIQSLESGLNQSLSIALADEAMKINSKGDSLFIQIERTRDIQLAYKNQLIYAAIPIKVRAVMKKTVLGFTISNADQPLVFAATASISGPFDLDEQWKPIYDFAWRSLEWEEPPVFDLMGFRLDLTEIVEGEIQKIIPRMNDKINLAVKSGARLDEHIFNAYQKIQEPVMIRLDGDNHFLDFDIKDLKGSFLSTVNDTLIMKIESKLTVDLSTEESPDETGILPKRKPVSESLSKFDLYVNAVIPFDYINEKAGNYIGESISFEGNNIVIDDLKFYSYQGYIQCDVTFSGDESGVITLYGIPSWENGNEIGIKQFGFDLKSGSDWIALADATLHSTFEKVIQQTLSYSVDNQLSLMELTIIDAVKQSNMGNKLDLNLKIDALSLHDLGITQEAIQLIVQINGKAEIILKEGLFGQSR